MARARVRSGSHRPRTFGVELPTREQQTPEWLRTFHKAEIDKWRPIIEAANVKPE
jgi:hypothetical protein